MVCTWTPHVSKNRSFEYEYEKTLMPLQSTDGNGGQGDHSGGGRETESVTHARDTRFLFSAWT